MLSHFTVFYSLPLLDHTEKDVESMDKFDIACAYRTTLYGFSFACSKVSFQSKNHRSFRSQNHYGFHLERPDGQLAGEVMFFCRKNLDLSGEKLVQLGKS